MLPAVAFYVNDRRIITNIASRRMWSGPRGVNIEFCSTLATRMLVLCPFATFILAEPRFLAPLLWFRERLLAG